LKRSSDASCERSLSRSLTDIGSHFALGFDTANSAQFFTLTVVSSLSVLLVRHHLVSCPSNSVCSAVALILIAEYPLATESSVYLESNVHTIYHSTRLCQRVSQITLCLGYALHIFFSVVVSGSPSMRYVDVFFWKC